MRRSKYRRANTPAWFSGRRRIIALAAASLAAFGGVVAVTQISNASSEDPVTKRALASCDNLTAPKSSRLSTQTRKGTYTTNNGRVTQHADDGAGDVATTAQVRTRCREWVMNNVASDAETLARRNRGRGNNNGGNQGGNNNGGNQGGNNGGNASAQPSTGAQPSNGAQPSTGAGSQPPAQGGDNGGNNNGGDQGGNNQGGNNNGGNQGGGNQNPAPQPTATTPPPGAGLGILTNSCDTSDLEDHDGFQRGNRCVSTEFGEVGAAANNPTLLITGAPRVVNRNQPFTLQVSTRNLIRDRFLAAGQGGYYVESSVLQGGLVRGHFHTACRILDNRNAAPAGDPVPAFFVATEDSRGGAQPDTVAIQVPGLPQSGEFQCSSWAGDGSHRIPMMERANQTPAFDSVRIRVR
ncbi:Pecanex-like protein 1 [Actinoplanes sp. NPDC023801]|uniref:Pecanex-like protein 1 n=1 Tax=Actinoplanes sp. NPDC023801 TaxID=3154595 RepID=UPI0033D73EC6